jgi:hypothetical protein
MKQNHLSPHNNNNNNKFSNNKYGTFEDSPGGSNPTLYFNSFLIIG